MKDRAKKEFKLYYHGAPVLTRSGAHMTLFAYSKIGAVREAYAYNILADRAEFEREQIYDASTYYSVTYSKLKREVMKQVHLEAMR